MSHFAEYIKERENKEIIEKDYGFATYQFLGSVCYIVDIFVVPSERKNKRASEMANAITAVAKEKGCTHLIGSVSLEVNQATESISVLIAYGFKVREYKENLLWFVKEIK
jgi:inorganic pyrophosphatase/exopolyphosphatase